MQSSQQFQVITQLKDFKSDFNLELISHRSEPDKVLMCEPTYFDIIDVKNVHMEGNKNNLDKSLAIEQWNHLRNIYNNLVAQGILKEVSIIKGEPNCEDMVFCANQTFPWFNQNVVLSNMKHASRQKEVPFFKSFFESKAYKTINLEKNHNFEGMGDAIPHPGLQLIYGGYGYRTSAETYLHLAKLLNVNIVLLELTNPLFYHLDTCFVPLNKESVMICSSAFNKEGLALIHKLFKNVYDIPLSEAKNLFSLNAHVIHHNNQPTAILQPNCTKTIEILKQEHFHVIETDTSEYMKSGGSVFCMKMMYY